MDLATMGSLVSTVGFPIAIALIFTYILYKILKVVLDRFLKSLDEITESNKILVQTNASFVGNVNTKMNDIEDKVDRIMEKLGCYINGRIWTVCRKLLYKIVFNNLHNMILYIL